MVTFALPGDYDAADAGHGTPRSRAPLPFAKRTYAATPYAKRLGTPQAASSRKLLTTRDEIPSSSLKQSTMSSSRNIFRASAMSDSPPTTGVFSPSLPQSTMKKVFAPGVTPQPNRVFRESTAQATPRGMAAQTSEKELFNMRIASPPPELTGEVLANKVPKEWNSKGSIYADQFLAHLCPPELDDEQRRQFFCVLDLRRLKYAANEIFAKKTWKLNIINFAKEFEKSRSIILLRYGLYEFQNVKPSKEVLRRWRREHGLPDPEEDNEAAEATPTKPATSKKRKADDNLSKDSVLADTTANAGKRRATVRDEQEEPTAATPAPNKNKRKALVSDEQPTKLQKAAPSSAKSLFEKIASKPAPAPSVSPAKNSVGTAAAKPATLGAAKPANGTLARSVFTSLKPPSTGAGGGNIFGYLSDASSAKNSGVEADAESETDSEEGSQEAGQSDEPSVAASGAGDTPSQTGSSLFGIKPASGLGTGASSANQTRENTPGRSLFDRITKDQAGQPLRAEESANAPPAKKPAPMNQTWNPSTTPIKFAPAAPAAQTSSLFGKSSSTSSGSIFAPNTTSSSNIFGAPKQDASVDEADKTGGESDKENDSQPSKKVASGPKGLAAQSNSGASLFGLKPATTEAPKANEPAKPATTGLFGAIPKSEAASALFGNVTTSAPVLSSTTLFGAKAAESETSKATSLFGAPSTSTGLNGASKGASLFDIKPTANPTNLFGTASSASSSAPSSVPSSLFGAASSSNASAPAKTTATSATAQPASSSLFGFGAATTAATAPAKTDSTPATQPPATPLFSFGPKPTATAQAAGKALFGTPKSPPSATANMFGSPMKQDEASPAKKPFTGGNTDAKPAAPLFSFGAPITAPSTNLFGGALNPASNTGASSAPAFGAAPSSNTGSSGFSFNFGSGGSSTTTSTFNNPFASGTGNTGGNSGPAASTSGGMFSFGASSAAPSGGSGSFQFGGPGSNQAGQTSTPLFGGVSSSGSTPAFNVTAPASQPSQGMFSFGASQPSSGFNLQPPAGGSSTTGTNSPFNLGGGSSLATTPAGGTPESSAQPAAAGADNDNEEGEKHEQISLTEGVEKDEEILHDVRAKVLKFVPATEASDNDDKPKSKSPWATQGVGPLRLLRHRETNLVRLLLRAEPRGNVAMNRSVLPELSYKADEKYVKLTTSNAEGNGLETWMIQVKTKDSAKALAEALEKHKELNKKK